MIYLNIQYFNDFNYIIFFSMKCSMYNHLMLYVVYNNTNGLFVFFQNNQIVFFFQNDVIYKWS